MKTKPHNLPRQDIRGSAFITVMIFTFVLIGIASTLIKWSVAERSLNVRNGYWLEARNAAEAVAEFGFSQVSTEFGSTSSPPTFDPATGTALSLPPASFFPSEVDTNAYSAAHPTGMQLIGGTAITIPPAGSTTALYYVDPADPNNRLDPLKGQWVYRRDIQVLARASVLPPSVGRPVTAYVTQTVSVRGAPLFSHAIFYSANDLEIFPGPIMNVYGPVHTNGNMFVSSQGSSLSFHGAVSMSGNLYHAWSNSASASEGAGGETLGQSPVNFTEADGTTLKNLNSSGTPTSNGVSTDWRDSTYGADNGVKGLSSVQALVTAATTANFRQFAAQNFNGNLQTSAMNVQPYYPVAFNEVVDAAGDTADPHVMIDPPNATLSPTDPYYDAKSKVEAGKMSNQAGLYIQVDMTNLDASGNPAINIYGPPGSAPVGTPAAQVGPNGGIKLTNPGNLGNNPSDPTNPPLVTYLPFRRAKVTYTTTKSGSTYTTKPTYTVYKADGTLDSSASMATNITNAVTANTTTSHSGTVGTTAATYQVFSDPATGSTFGFGMYDQRRDPSGGKDYSSASTMPANDPGMTDVVQIDMKALGAAVTSMVTKTADTNSIKTNSGAAVWSDSSPTGWNGGVYVDVKTAQAPAATPYVSSDYPAALASQTTSLRLVDGTVASGSSLVPSFGQNGNGLTIATNAPVYIVGNFNADGTGASPTTPDDGHTDAAGDLSAESPVCVAADAVTLLSSSWKDSSSLSLKPTATNTEYATAILTGLVPTTSGDSSGGVHNLPRFLESWGSSTTATIRGSLVTMYNCKVATQGWSTKYYDPPARNWGFDKIFQNGTYPPITPKVMSYRRVLYSSMTATTYASGAHALWPGEF